MPLTQLISMLPVALNGVGLTEWVFAAIFDALGPGATAGLMVALLVRFRNALWAAGGYAIWLATGAPRSGTADRGGEAVPR